ncbi:MAG: formimidoylglutamate deiminase [Gaiellales bacterium]
MAPAPLRLPGFVNAHSHAFQRELRGRVERIDPSHPQDDFWTWREEMYRAASALDPDSMYAIARLAYGEMLQSGYTVVGEFHYPHHRPDGTPYPDRNAMSRAIVAAAADTGIELVLLMTAYARAGPGLPPTPGQRRFCDPSAGAYLERVDEMAGECRVGLAPHSVRALPRDWLQEIARHADRSGLVVHVHACEQRAEIAQCLEEHGRRPIELLADVGLLGPRTTVVHATHADESELRLLAESGASVCACPTTEANLGDGFLPAERLLQLGVPVCIGSDSNTVIDPILELREIEACARRQAERRNVLVPDGDDGPAAYLLQIGTQNGARSLGLDGPVGEVAVDLEHPQLLGVDRRDLPAALLFGGTAAALIPESKGSI